MRWLVVAVALLMAGCASPSNSPVDSQDDRDSDGDLVGTPIDGAGSTGSASGTSTTPTSGPTGASGNDTGNATEVPSGNATANATAQRGIVVHSTKEGSLPVDGAVTAKMTFNVPAGADELVFIYTSEHVGLFTSLVRVADPAATTKLDSSDVCGFGSVGAETDVCTMKLQEPLASGPWTATITWQVGQATENYTFDATVWGNVTA